MSHRRGDLGRMPPEPCPWCGRLKRGMERCTRTKCNEKWNVHNAHCMVALMQAAHPQLSRGQYATLVLKDLDEAQVRQREMNSQA